MSGSRIRPYLGPLIAMLVILALGVGTVYAAIPNPTNKKFYACLVKKSGDVRLINYPTVSTCKKGERLVNWNAKGPTGPQGAQGPVGPQGPQGPAGEAGITRITLTRYTSDLVVPPNDATSAVVTCPTGKVVGGGFSDASEASPLVTTSSPEGTAGWKVAATNSSGTLREVTIHALCMTTEPATVIATSKVKVAKKKGK